MSDRARLNLERLQEYHLEYHLIVTDAMSALNLARRKHRGECTRKLDEDGLCPCGATEVNIYIERMAWMVRCRYFKILELEPEEWDETTEWTEEPLPTPGATSPSDSLHSEDGPSPG
jgi:hypothetical protein